MLVSRLPRSALGVLSAVAVMLPLLLGPSAASAKQRYWRYHTTTSVTLRSGPSYNVASVGRVGRGTPVDIVCQAYSGWPFAYVGGSNVWDRLTGGQWVSDYFVDTPLYARISLREC